ncbi:neuropeptide Y receptor type 1-like, partial [Saccoglossus kowalevskii]|uniref:Neuropeptide Y receptor type 1-like n=1 Tax=Saccoglossus kowalevskii TaxID=10224 RepID=A0ABM0MB61_SACKO
MSELRDNDYDVEDGFVGSNSTTNTSEYEYLDMELPLQYQIILSLTFTCNMVLSILGNVIVLCVLILGKSSRTGLSAFLVNLAVADLFMAIFCMPFTFPTIMLGRWIFGKGMCPTVIFLQQ